MMSTHPSTHLTRPSDRPLRPASPIEVNTPIQPCLIPQSITIRWAISRAALSDLAPVGQSTLLHLECLLSPPHAPVWTIIDPANNARRLVELAPPEEPPAITCTEHAIELVSPTLRAHILRNKHNSHAPLYVRTDIFSTLNIAGGRYTPISAALEFAQ